MNTNSIKGIVEHIDQKGILYIRGEDNRLYKSLPVRTKARKKQQEREPINIEVFKVPADQQFLTAERGVVQVTDPRTQMRVGSYETGRRVEGPGTEQRGYQRAVDAAHQIKRELEEQRPEDTVEVNSNIGPTGELIRRKKAIRQDILNNIQQSRHGGKFGRVNPAQGQDYVDTINAVDEMEQRQEEINHRAREKDNDPEDLKEQQEEEGVKYLCKFLSLQNRHIKMLGEFLKDMVGEIGEKAVRKDIVDSADQVLSDDNSHWHGWESLLVEQLMGEEDGINDYSRTGMIDKRDTISAVRKRNKQGNQ